MVDSLYADFKKAQKAMLASSENTEALGGGTAGTAQMASKGILLKFQKPTKEYLLGSSGIQVSLDRPRHRRL